MEDVEIIKGVLPKESMKLIDQINYLTPCSPAVTWIDDKTLDEAWSTCERGDWMLWLAGSLNIDRKTLVRAANACARTLAKYTIDERVHRCIDITDRWCNGLATDDELRVAVQSAEAAAWAAEAAEWAAAWAAEAEAAAWAATHKEHADIVRRLIPVDVIRAIINKETR